MSTQHSKAAARFLQNAEKAKWHDATFWSVRTKRDNQARQLDEWERLREAASQIKMHTITHLDHYIAQFAEEAEKKSLKEKRAEKQAAKATKKKNSTSESGRVGDRPYARGRSYDPEHYGE